MKLIPKKRPSPSSNSTPPPDSLISIQIGCNVTTKQVIMLFGVPTKDLVFEAAAAREIGRQLQLHADKAEGIEAGGPLPKTKARR